MKTKISVPGLNTVSIKSFAKEGKHKGALKVKQSNGDWRFCVESLQVGNIGSKLTLDKRTGFIAIPQNLYSLIQGDALLTEGFDYNELLSALGLPKVAVYFQKSLTPFYDGQEHVKYTDATGTEIDALTSKGERFYRSPVVRELGTYKDTWGTIETTAEGKSVFVVDNKTVPLAEVAGAAVEVAEQKTGEETIA